ncbi:hypothetical protein GGI20_003344 [Coemansia sp. BCRC 34301]|nr:hypothetical protein GGI20_003344 [Coemansia sp. BCRC 34301]
MSGDQYASYTAGSPPLNAPGADRRSDQQQQQLRYSPVAAHGGRHPHTQVQYPVAGMSTAPQRRRLSNAPSDGITEGRSHAGPPPPVRQTAACADHDATSEDEIESLKRDMGSDLWALQRQRMRREQLNNNNRQWASGSTTESPGSPLTQDASPVAKSKAFARVHYQQPAGLALHRQEISPPEHASQPEWPAYATDATSGPIESAVPPPHGYPSAYIYPGTGSPTQPYAQVTYAHHQPHYAHHPHHHAQTTLAYSAAAVAAAAYAAQAPAPAYVHGRQLTTAPPLPPIVDATSASRDYSVPPGYATDAPHYAHKLWPTTGGYPVVTANQQQQQQQQQRLQHATNPFAAVSHVYPGGSSASTDHHMRPPLPEQAGIYQAQHNTRYPRQPQQQSPPPMAPARSPLHHAVAVGSPPMEQKRVHGYVETAQPAAVYSSNSGAPAVRTTADHVTDMGSTAAYHATSYTSRAQHYHQQQQTLPGAAARVSPPMQEMQEQHSTLTHVSAMAVATPESTTPLAATFARLSPSALQTALPLLASSPPPQRALSDLVAAAGTGGAKAPSAIAIQSLLNSPLDDVFPETVEEADGRSSNAESGVSESAAIHQHIAKENARFRQNSSTSGRLTIPSHIAPSAPSAHHHPHNNNNNNSSSPNSRSSYHSAGYSMWHGRAETVNMDFATAQQSLSSTDDAAGLGLSMVNDSQRMHPAHLPSAPLPAIPASLTYAANAAAAIAVADAIDSLPPPAHPDGHQYRYYRPNNKRDSKPISVLVQVSDGSREGSVISDSDGALALSPSSPSGNPAQSLSESIQPGSDLPKAVGEGDSALADDDIARIPLGRKGTNESLDNVLEYYRTHSSDALDKRASSAELAPGVSDADLASKAGTDAAARVDSVFDAGFQSPQSLAGAHMAATAAVESVSSVHTRQHYDGWPESHYSSLGTIQPPADSSVLGTHPHTREHTPMASYSLHASSHGSPSPPLSRQLAVEMHDNEQLLSARHWHIDIDDSHIAAMDVYGPHVAPNPWRQQQRQTRPAYHPHNSMYNSLEQLPEPDALELPPTTVAEMGPRGSDTDADDCVVQMEMIDGISELSDMLDMSTTHDSDYGYSTSSNSSTDSFGEPIEHETGILAKSLGPRLHNIAALTDMSESVSRLASDFSRTALAPDLVIHQMNAPSGVRSEARHGPRPSVHSYLGHVVSLPSATGTPRLSAILASNQPNGAARLLSEIDEASAEALHSGRTNASTLTMSTTGLNEHAVAADTGNREHYAQGASASAPGASAAPTAMMALATADTVPTAAATTATANNMPLEIMELAGELEISLAREQEDYYSDNVSQANLDPMILQNLGKAVHQQCLLQRQNVQRRKSNMHLGLAAGGNSSSDEHGGVFQAADMQYDDYEQALKAMLVEVSQYFVQSGLNQVFPFSAKWVDWLTRHPDRPFPWRKDSEDDEETNCGGHGGGGGEDDDSDSRSDASSFGEEPPAPSRPLPPEDVLSKATIPMSMRRPVLVKDFVSQEKRKGINAHWQYYSVINQITAVASGIHRRLVMAEADADHSFVAHQLAALYQFLGGDFKKFKPGIESIFETIKQSLCVKSAACGADDKPGDGSAAETSGACQATTTVTTTKGQPKVLDGKCVSVLRDMMASIIAEALYSTSKVAAVGVKEQPPPNTPTAGIRAAKQAAVVVAAQTQTPGQTLAQHAATDVSLVREATFAISTLKGLPTQPIVRYLAKEMRTANGERRRRGLAHNLSRNNSMGHLRHHHQFPYQAQQPPLPPLPLMPAVVPAAAVAAAAALPHNYNVACHSGSSSSASSTSHAPILAGEQNRVRRNNTRRQTPMPKQQQQQQQRDNNNNVADAALLQPIPSAAAVADEDSGAVPELS